LVTVFHKLLDLVKRILDFELDMLHQHSLAKLEHILVIVKGAYLACRMLMAIHIPLVSLDNLELEPKLYVKRQKLIINLNYYSRKFNFLVKTQIYF
jgi:hypothetical protein